MSDASASAAVPLAQLRIGFLGAGKMARSILRGLLALPAGARPAAFSACDPHWPEELSREFSELQRRPDAAALEAGCDLMLLCVKPQDMEAAVQTLRGNKKYVSIAAGLSLERLAGFFSAKQVPQLCRVMPNISATVGRGVSALYAPDPALLEESRAIFAAIGLAVTVPKEDLMHAVTGLSGSGPAYVFAFIQALAEGGVEAGLPYDQALALAAETVGGAAELLKSSGKHPGELRNQVTSPGGTTIAGLKALEEGGFSSAVLRAVEAAAERSRKLGG